MARTREQMNRRKAEWDRRKRLSSPEYVAKRNRQCLEYYYRNKAKRLEEFQMKCVRNPIWKRLKDKRTECRERGLKFNLTEEWFLAHFSQGCAVAGVDLVIDRKSPWHAEIDRINHGGDYTMDNCRIVCAIYNRSRMNFSDSEVLEFAKMLVRNQ